MKPRLPHISIMSNFCYFIASIHRCEVRRNLPIHEGAKIVNTTLFELEKFMNHNERPILDVLIDEYKKKSTISFDVSDKNENSIERIFSSNDEVDWLMGFFFACSTHWTRISAY